MLQAIGLTSTPRRNRPPTVHDLTFEARPGRVTALFGAAGAGKTTALRLMLGLEHGRGVTYFRGRPLDRVAHPLREVGVLLGDVPGHPARTVHGQLRMLCAATGVPVERADELLDVVGLAELRDQRLGTLSLGMERRLGIAAALLGDPHTLVLDEPAAGLSPREAGWLSGVLRAHAAHGGTVLFTTSDPRQAARVADRVVAVAAGRLVADQDVQSFAATRLRPRVAVHTPHAARLAALLGREARTARRALEVVTESGNRLHVYGGTCADVGEVAFRHGILLHRLADETGPGPAAPEEPPGEAAVGGGRDSGNAVPATGDRHGRLTPAPRRPSADQAPALTTRGLGTLLHRAATASSARADAEAAVTPSTPAGQWLPGGRSTGARAAGFLCGSEAVTGQPAAPAPPRTWQTAHVDTATTGGGGEAEAGSGAPAESGGGRRRAGSREAEQRDDGSSLRAGHGHGETLPDAADLPGTDRCTAPTAASAPTAPDVPAASSPPAVSTASATPIASGTAS
ncbi:ATP-binding cassette domain-containing protein, partial [Streptomyces sp. CC77]|uniref:ATP-binding cassette domain-containing protein n=1 Tax=Streptomyces sp. CC77 TaxID=1906739 RepID=UPI000D1AB14D